VIALATSGSPGSSRVIAASDDWIRRSTTLRSYSRVGGCRHNCIGTLLALSVVVRALHRTTGAMPAAGETSPRDRRCPGPAPQPPGRRLLLSCLQRSLTRLAPGASGPDVERRLGGVCAFRAKRAPHGPWAKYRGANEAGLANAVRSSMLLLPGKGAVRRYRCVSINAAATVQLVSQRGRRSLCYIDRNGRSSQREKSCDSYQGGEDERCI
jgi:hypothetical protein